MLSPTPVNSHSETYWDENGNARTEEVAGESTQVSPVSFFEAVLPLNSASGTWFGKTQHVYLGHGGLSDPERTTKRGKKEPLQQRWRVQVPGARARGTSGHGIRLVAGTM
jgi:hypothetical protein